MIHVSGTVGLARDAEVINLEPGWPISQIDKRRERLKKQMRTSKEAQVEDAALERIQEVLEKGGSARSVALNDDEAAMIKPLAAHGQADHLRHQRERGRFARKTWGGSCGIGSEGTC